MKGVGVILNLNWSFKLGLQLTFVPDFIYDSRLAPRLALPAKSDDRYLIWKSENDTCAIR